MRLDRFRPSFYGLLFVFVLLFATACLPIRPVVRNSVGQELPLLNQAVDSVTAVANVINPIDAMPSPDGALVYFTAQEGTEATLSVVAATGGAPKILVSGAPLVDPRGLTLSEDGETIYVADRGAELVWQVAAVDGAVSPVAGTEGIAAQSVELANSTNGGQLYISGNRGGKPGIWSVPTNGGDLTVVAEGAPFVNPMGIAATQDGTLYVVDHDGSGNDQATVVRIADGTTTIIARDFRAGYQAGAALTLDEQVLLVSALDPQRASAQVLLVNLTSLQTGVVTKVVAANAGSGGVHRAQQVNLFAWADGQHPIQKPGHVYVIKPPQGD